MLSLSLSSDPLPPELERLGCTWSSTVHEFWAACSPRLHPNGKYKQLCEQMAEDMVDKHGVMSVAQMPHLYRHQWADMFKARGANPGWIDTFMRILGTELKIMPHDKVLSVPESVIKLNDLEEQISHKNSFKSARFAGQSSNLGAILKYSGKLEGVELPASVLDAPTECPDPSSFTLSYNDVKAVSKEIFLWVIRDFKTVYIDKMFALQVEKLLLAANFRPIKEGKRWWKIILDRFENGRRAHAKVQLPFQSRSKPQLPPLYPA